MNGRADMAKKIKSEDVADSGLIDVSGLDMRALQAEAQKSGLGRALDQILASGKDSEPHHFQSSI